MAERRLVEDAEARARSAMAGFAMRAGPVIAAEVRHMQRINVVSPKLIPYRSSESHKCTTGWEEPRNRSRVSRRLPHRRLRSRRSRHHLLHQGTLGTRTSGRRGDV